MDDKKLADSFVAAVEQNWATTLRLGFSRVMGSVFLVFAKRIERKGYERGVRDAASVVTAKYDHALTPLFLAHKINALLPKTTRTVKNTDSRRK